MTTGSKQRLDIILVNKGLALSRKEQSVLFFPGLFVSMVKGWINQAPWYPRFGYNY